MSFLVILIPKTIDVVLQTFLWIYIIWVIYILNLQ